MELLKPFKKLSAYRWWDMSLLVGLAIAIMIYTRFFGLGEPYIKAFDPYLFWRIAETIWNQGFWPGPDALRYFPFGWESQELTPAVPYTLVYLGKLAGNLKAAVKAYPAIFGIMSIVSMALLGKKLGFSGLGATILAVIPAYMYRTSQGFADKEALAFFLGLLGWYFVSIALEKKQFLPAVYAGIAIGMMAAAWGGKVMFIFALAPLMFILAMQEDTKRVALISTTYVIYTFMDLFVPRYRIFWKDPIALAILGVAVFGFLVHFIYKIPALKKYKRKRLLVAGGLGAASLVLMSAAFFDSPLYVADIVLQTYQSPTAAPTTIHHGQTVAENQRASWSWTLGSNQFWGQFGAFFFLALGALILPIARKAYGLATRDGAVSQDYFYAGALVLAVLWVLKDFPHQAPIILFLLSLPTLLETKDWKTVFVLSIVAFSMYSAFSAVRLFVFTSVGVALGAAYILKRMLADRDMMAGLVAFSLAAYPLIQTTTLPFLVALFGLTALYFYLDADNKKWISSFAGIAMVALAFIQIYPYTAGYTVGLGGTSLTTTWFENAKWMEFNVPAGEPIVTWWDYGYWIQTLGNSTSLGDGGNVGPGYTINWYTGNFFSQDDYDNATAWADDWDLTYFTIDAQMLPKFWAYSTLGGRSNLLNQISYQRELLTEFGMIDIYGGWSDDLGEVAIGELPMDNQVVYIVGRVVGGRITEWVGIIDEFAYFSQAGVAICDPIGYCKSADFGNLQRINQSIVVYPRQMIIMGDQVAMHSMFPRLWFFNGYNTEFRQVLNNGETKTFVYTPGV